MTGPLTHGRPVDIPGNEERVPQVPPDTPTDVLRGTQRSTPVCHAAQDTLFSPEPPA